MNHRRIAVAAGLAGAVAYVVGATLTGTLDSRLARPLLDGYAPPTPYKWVNAPHIPGIQYATDKPVSVQQNIPLTAVGPRVTVMNTSDGQFSVLLDTNVVAPMAGERSVLFAAAPLDAATLGRPPSGLQIAGNVYHVTASYQPGGVAVTTVHGHNNLTLTYPLLALSGPGSDTAVHSILFSADGHSWQPAADGGQDNQANQSVIAPFVGPGYYAVATPALGKHHGGLRSYLLIGVFIAAGVITVALVAFTYRSRRARLVRRRS